MSKQNDGDQGATSPSAPGGQKPPSPPKPSSVPAGDPTLSRSLVIESLSRRALCPDCVHLGGCEYGFPGLIAMPQRDEKEVHTGKSEAYLRKLITPVEGEPLVVGFQVLTRSGAARGETFVGGASFCELLKRGRIGSRGSGDPT